MPSWGGLARPTCQPRSRPFCTSCVPVLAHAAVEFPPWQTVYGYFPPWRDQGSWKRIHRYLRGWYGSGASAPVPQGGHCRHSVGATRLPHPPGPRL
ncbi:MAG: hypothetical protein BRC53_06200 [Cyanobacteria bacterium SW_6_48_11]|nr:MAG: hypothetical protein BRC53_06200 [Cyanobacteria bacterium SW_6_48_11]